MAADLSGEADRPGMPLHCSKDVPFRHSSVGELSASPADRTEERAVTVLGNAGGRQVGVEELVGFVVGGHLVKFAALLVEAEPTSPALNVVVLHGHLHHGADTGKAVGHDGEDCPVAKTENVRGRDRLQEVPRFVLEENRRFPQLHYVLRAAHGGGRIEPDGLADHEIVHEHPNRCEVLLHRGGGGREAELFDVGGHEHGFELLESPPVRIAPVEKARYGVSVGAPGIWIADVRGEVLQKPAGGLLAGRHDQSWKLQRAAKAQGRRG